VEDQEAAAVRPWEGLAQAAVEDGLRVPGPLGAGRQVEAAELDLVYSRSNHCWTHYPYE